EWTISPSLFTAFHYEYVRVQNLVGSDGILNTRTDLSNLERLRNRVLTPPTRTDELEDTPVFSGATARRAHVAFETLLTRTLAMKFHYTHARTYNTDVDPVYAGRRIPWVPDHRADVGAVWTPGWAPA